MPGFCFALVFFRNFTSFRAVKLGCFSTKKEFFFVLSSICTHFTSLRAVKLGCTQEKSK